MNLKRERDERGEDGKIALKVAEMSNVLACKVRNSGVLSLFLLGGGQRERKHEMQVRELSLT